MAASLRGRVINSIVHGYQQPVIRALNIRLLSDKAVDWPSSEPPIPEYKSPENEPTARKRARLLYQSRKRGMLENGLLLSTFADKHLDSLNDQLLEQYDRLINQPSNDWEIYYWMTEKKQTPEEYENQIMDMLKNHAKNENMEERIKQPELQHKK
ncbi:PREDICTED: succinate dehydrogenase assembly factor 2, mitochondrial-like [Acropora digitifera]|uniref:succinate dehydrogenase assembly factor 2, mitochondrial-like n=1 Tax=Acropora digitifera TaxID=70779 RepID=UPI00077A618A|nr:PREDICTED: succinate dehydrogenase assembly factor 2, mitochondrial-like [Acropora digitifera]